MNRLFSISSLFKKTKIEKESFMFFSIFIAAFILRLINIDRCFDVDEYKTFITSSLGFSAMFKRLLVDSHPPLYNLILHFWLLISHSESWLRLISVISGVLVYLFLYRLNKVALGSRIALLALGFSAILPQAVWNSQYIRAYSLSALFIVIGIYYFIRLFIYEEKNIKLWILSILFLLLSIHTFYFNILIIITINLFVWTYFKKRPIFYKKWLISQIVLFTCFLPGIYFLILQLQYFLKHPLESSRIGFYMGNIHVGVMVRSLLGILGIDHNFLFETHVSALFPRYMLISVSIVAVITFIGLMTLLLWTLILKSTTHTERTINTLYFYLSFLPFFLAMAVNTLVNVVISQQYFYISTLFFYSMISSLLFKIRYKSVRLLIIFSLILILCFRLIFVLTDKGADFKGLFVYLNRESKGAKNALIFIPFYGIESYYFKKYNNKYTLLNIEPYLKKDKDVFIVSERLKDDLYKFDNIYYIYHSSSFHHQKENKAVKNRLIENNFFPESELHFGDLVLFIYKI